VESKISIYELLIADSFIFVVRKIFMKNYLILTIAFAFILSGGGCQCHKKNSGSSKTPVVIQKDTFTLKETCWKLVELNGKPVKDTLSGSYEAYIIFNINGSNFNGSGGCNRIFGNYEQKGNNLLHISQVGMTKMACLDATLDENELLNTLEKVNLFTIKGKTLTLYKAVKSPLAKFEAIRNGPAK
jgi:heat shock protein HslJ